MTASNSSSVFNGLFKDFLFGLRQLRQRPGFTAVAIVVLALGLGANAAIFSVVNAVLLKPLPYPHPETLVEVFERDVIDNTEEDHYNWVSAGNFEDWRRDARSVNDLTAVRYVSFNISSASESFTAQRINGIACSSTFPSVLGVTPALGRFFGSSEDKPNAPLVVVLSYRFWQQHFAGSPKILGQQVHLDGNSYTVLGVLPASFSYPGDPADVFVSFDRGLEPSNRGSHSNHFFEAIGRLAPGYSAAQAQQEISAIVRNFRRGHPAEIMGHAATVIQLDRYLVRNIRTGLLVLLGSVGCLLLIACVNIANLLLTQALGRQRELAIRSAVGASRTQIVRQLLIESTTISILGAIAGLIVAAWASSFLAAHAPGAAQLPQMANIRIDRAVLLFTTGIALLTGMAAGLFPALAASRTDLVNSLKDSSRSATASRSHGRLRSALVAIEVALSLVLLVAAGLLLHSFFKIESVRPGFHMENSVSFALSLPKVSYKNREAVANFARRFAEDIRSVPGVVSAGLVSYPPLAGRWNDSVFHIKGHPLPPGSMMDLITRSADPDYFHAVGIPLLEGRFFTAQDGIGYDDKNPRLGQALISESAAKRFFKNMDPVGQILLPGSDMGFIPNPSGNPYPLYQIVGVVGDVPASVEDGIQPTMYRPIFDGRDNEFYTVVRSKADPLALTAHIQSAVHRLDPDVPLHDIRTFAQINTRVTGDRRFSVSLLLLFAGVALVLAAIGLYGVVSHAVKQRTSEIGIRIALGAARSEVSGLILLDGMKPALAGVMAGIVASIALTRFLSSMLFEVSSLDGLTFIVVPVLLILVVALACLMPALRATQIDPTVALRSE